MSRGIPQDLHESASKASAALGPPVLGVVLGSGFGPLAECVATGPALTFDALPVLPAAQTDGHGGRVSSVERAGGRVWMFEGRAHLYEGYRAAQVAAAVALLAAAGARGVLLTCAAGGLAEHHAPGDLALVTDHLNLTGDDPLRGLVRDGGGSTFVDLQRVYDPSLGAAWLEAARRHGVPLEAGVLAAVAGPCYETPAEVRMLRALGADLVSMSVVPEAIAARYHGLRAAALACIANRGAGMDGGRPIDHGDVLARVRRAVARRTGFLLDGLDGMLRRLVEAVPSFDGPAPYR